MSGGLLEALAQLPILARFAVAMAVILVLPELSEEVRLPVVVGLLLAGIGFGPHGLNVRPKSHEVTHFFAMWSLSLPQVAATLPAALVAFEARNAEGRG
jgi:hypothetical protein